MVDILIACQFCDGPNCGGLIVESKDFGRVDRDAWFTPRSTSLKIVDFLLLNYPEWREMEWVEPSAGDGSFIDACQARGLSITGYDLEPQREDIIRADFLDFNENLFSDFIDLSGKIVVGNPPYGFRNKLTIDFINHAFNLGAEKVAFLVLSGMMSASYLGKIKRQIELVKFIDTSFIVDGVEYTTNFSLALIVFGKERDRRDWGELAMGPYCRVVEHGDTIEDDHVIAGHHHLGYVGDFGREVEISPTFNVYSDGKKAYRIYEFTDRRLLDFDGEFLTNIFSKILVLGNRPSSSTVNYWLEPENMCKVDWEAL